MKKKIVKNKGILFWITGLSGSGKTEIAKKIKASIEKKYGPTILINGDDMRNIFNLNKFTNKERIANGVKFGKFSKFVTDQNINIIFALVSLRNKTREWNRKYIANYLEIYVKADIEKIIKSGKKKIYKKYKKNIVGLDIKAEFPKSPDIVIENNFSESLKKISLKLLNKIEKVI